MSKQPESESPRFQCPACGTSFEVASWHSSRIYCSRKCRAVTTQEHGGTASQLKPSASEEAQTCGGAR